MSQPRKQVPVFRELPPAQLARLQAAHDVTVANPRAGQRDAFEVTCLPHIGLATHETRLAMADLGTTNLLAALAGEPPAAVYTGDQGQLFRERR
ncbi:MAG: hypothetical protein ACYC0T_13905 [Ramlibacter sp.]